MAEQDRTEITRRHILDVAAGMFGRMGYVSTNLHDIVTCADVAKGVMFFHFGSKESLARELIGERDRRVSTAAGVVEASSSTALEKAIQISLSIAALAASDEYVIAGDRLRVEIGDSQGNGARPVSPSVTWLNVYLDQAVEQGDVVAAESAALSLIVLSHVVGARLVAQPTSRFPDAVTSLEQLWRLLVRSVVTETRQGYFTQAVARIASGHRAELGL